MSSNVSSTKKSLYEQLSDSKAIFSDLLVMTALLSALLVFDFWAGSAKVIWLLGFVIIAAWMPLIVSTMSKIYRQQPWLAFLYILVVAQTAHTIEHLAQMVEIHLLGLSGPQASGIIGFLNVEWVHLVWNSLILLSALMLLFVYRRNIWLWILFIFAIYHEAEHVYIVSMYIKTGKNGIPGLLAKGGIIGGGLPIARPDLHALYAIFEIALLLMIYLGEQSNFKRLQQVETTAQVAAG